MSYPLRMAGGGLARSLAYDRSVADWKVAPGVIRRIIGFAEPYKTDIGTYMGLLLLGAGAGIAQPMLFREIIDEGIAGSQPEVVIELSAAVAGLALVSFGLALAQRFFSARIGHGLVHDLRTEVVHHVHGLPIAFFKRTQTGALVSRLNNDVQGAQQAFTSILSTTVSSIINTVMVVGAMLTLSRSVTLMALAMTPLFVLPARLAGRKLAQLTRERYDLNADMGQTMTEQFNVVGATLVKSFGREEAEAAAFSQGARRVRDIGVRIAVYSRILGRFLGLLAALATAVVYGVGGLMAISGSLGVGTVVALTAYLGRLYGPITALSNVQVDVKTMLVSFERVFEVLDLEPNVADALHAEPLPDNSASIEFERVTFRYPSASEVSIASLDAVAKLTDAPNKSVLNSISFTVEKGQTIALVGPSGAGKTTVINLLLRLYDASDGTVRIGGIDVRDVTQASLRKAIGIVTQDSHLFHTTLRANLAYAKPGATEDEIWAALHAVRVGDLVASLPDGLDTIVGDRGYELSGGERQRIAMARLLLKDPRIVILDEATAHLDSESELAVLKALASVLAARTSIIIAHRLSTVREADQILVLNEGRVIECGGHAELLAAGGFYADLYRTQVKGDEAVAFGV